MWSCRLLVLHRGTGRNLLVYTSNLWWVTQSESTTLNEKLAVANFRSMSLIHFRWLTTDYPWKQANHDLFPSVERVVLSVFSAFNLASQFCQPLSNYGVQMILLLIIIRKTILKTSLNDFYTYLVFHLSIQLTVCLMHPICYVSLSTA